MKTMNKLFIIMVVCAFVAVPFASMIGDNTDASDEATIMVLNDGFKEFTDKDAGNVKVSIANKTANPTKFVIIAYDATKEYNPDKVYLKSEVIELAAAGTDGDNRTYDMSWNLGSSGKKDVRFGVFLESDLSTPIATTMKTIDVGHSIWSDPITYVVIVLVVIVIIVIIALKIRSSGIGKKSKSSEPTKTFTEIEEERKAKKSKRKSK